jgi:hypothetical protein
MKKSLILLTVAMVAGCGSLFGSMSETFSHTTAQQNVPFTDGFTLPAFNKALGTLTSIELKITNNSFATVVIRNFSTLPQAYTNANASVKLQFIGPDGTKATVVATSGPFSGTVPGAPSGGFSTSSITGAVNTTSTSTFVPSAMFSNYETPPSGVSLNFAVSGLGATYSGNDTSGTGALSFGGSSVEGGTTSIIYTYDSVVPEPAMLGVLSLGMIGLALASRKRYLKN